MKKSILTFILLILIFPLVVSAEVCQKDDIVISKIELNEVRGNAEEISEPNNDNNQLNLNAKMNVIGDSLTYKIVIKNTSNSDYVFDKNQITKDYINYDITYEDNSNIIKEGEEKTIYLKLKYDSKPQLEALSNGILQENNLVSFQLINEKGDSLINPETGNKVFFILLLVFLIITLFFIKNSKRITTIVIIISLFLIPQMVKAICTCSLDINLNIEIDAKEAMFLPGKEFNTKMKELAGNDISSVQYPFTIIDTNITSIKKEETEPNESNKEEKNVVSITDSPYPIYIRYEDGTIFWWSEDETPSLNKDASMMFSSLSVLSDINSFSKFDVSNTNSLEQLFYYGSSLSNIESLSNWNMQSVETMRGMFINTSITDLNPISKWNLSSVKILKSVFQGIKTIEGINSLKNWDTSNVEDMSYLFNKCSNLEDISVLSNWNTDKVTNMSYMFPYSRISNLNSIENWNVSKVTTMRGMFMSCSNLTDASSINNWNISNVTDYTYMFLGNTIHPDFSKVNGTWSNGTFTPTE